MCWGLWWQYKGCLGKVELARDTLKIHLGQVVGIGYNGQRIAAKTVLGKNVIYKIASHLLALIGLLAHPLC